MCHKFFYSMCLALSFVLFLHADDNLPNSYDFGKPLIIHYSKSQDTKLPPKELTNINALAKFLLLNPKLAVRVIGHSDNTGTFDENEYRAIQRVNEFTDYLVAQGIGKSKILARAEGALSPIHDMDSEYRLKNNRLEIQVLFDDEKIKAMSESGEYNLNIPDDTQFKTKHDEPIEELNGTESNGEHQKSDFNPIHDSNIQHDYSHHITVMGGATTSITEFDAANTFGTLGIDYEYIFDGHLWALGIFTEAVFASHNEYLAGIPIYFYPWKQLKFWAAPGVEYAYPHSGHHDFTPSEENTIESDLESSDAKYQYYFLFRMGVGYDFHIGSMTITPMLDIDYFGDHFYFVHGAALGWVF